MDRKCHSAIKSKEKCQTVPYFLSNVPDKHLEEILGYGMKGDGNPGGDCSDMENVPSKPSAAWVIFLGSVKCFTVFVLRIARILSSILYLAVGGIFFGLGNLPGYVTLPSLSNFT